jgi:hydroxyacylglutathione hydrolase
MSDVPQSISKEELAQILDRQEVLIIDVRLNWDESGRKVKSARHEDPEKVSSWAAEYPRDHTVVVYCSTPGEQTSAEVAAKLIDAGFSDVRVLRGGWTVWTSANLPTQRASEPPTPGRLVGGVLTD